jgi:uncharacterized protein YbjT (DUF2867 family)
MILVTGATGKTGSRVLALLGERGVKARAMVRTPSRASTLPDGVEVAVADFDDRSGLDAAVSGCTAVYLVSPAGPHQLAHEAEVIDAVVRSGTGAQVVKVAALGVGDPRGGRISVQHGLIRDHLAASGLPWTVLALSQLMDNLFLYASPVLEQGVLPVPAGDARVSWIDAGDVAAVAVETITTPGHVGRTYDLTGPEALHHDRVAELLSDVVGRRVRYVDTSPHIAAAAMIGAGRPEWTAHGVVETNEFYRQGGAQHISDVVFRLTAREPTTMASFLAATSSQWVRRPQTSGMS